MEDTVSRAEFEALRSEVRQGTAYINTRLDSMDLHLLRQSTEMKEMRTEMKEMRIEMHEQISNVRQELKQYVHDAVDGVMAGMERLFDELRGDIQKLESKIIER